LTAGLIGSPIGSNKYSQQEDGSPDDHNHRQGTTGYPPYQQQQ